MAEKGIDFGLKYPSKTTPIYFSNQLTSRWHISIMINVLKKERLAPLAQLVEQLTLNQWVPGSNP